MNAQSPWENLGTLPAQIFGTPITVYTDWNPQNATQYDYTILASNTFGATLSDIRTVQTPSCTPPTITSVNIIQGSTGTTFSGAGRTSGLLSDEGGSNWRNSIFVTLNANPTAPSTVPIKESYLTFQNGPQLAHTTSTGSIPGCNGNYCVRENNQWVAVPLVGRDAPQGCSGRSCDYSIVPISGPAWEVFFHERFGSRSMNISGYVRDENGLCSNNRCEDSDLNALQQP